MATTTAVPVNLDTPITVKVSFQGSTKRLKVPLGDLTSAVLPGKLRQLLQIPDGEVVVFERYSDSAGKYITLDPENQAVYKTLFRAAKAKLKLRLKATMPNEELTPIAEASQESEVPPPPPVPTMSRPNRVPQPLYPTYATLPTMPMMPTMPAPPARMAADGPSNTMKEKYPVVDVKHINMANEKGEAPLPKPFPATREGFFAELANIARARELSLREKTNGTTVQNPACSWSVYCNSCDKPMANEHYHCNICDDGDYDLCEGCVQAGHHCPGENHWLIKRFVSGGKVINSVTEKVAPKAAEVEKTVPGAYTEEKKEEPEVPTRTCNSCVKGTFTSSMQTNQCLISAVCPENEFVTCTTCDDFDLCIDCHVRSKHGHHPGHAFKAAVEDFDIGPLAQFLCASGRNLRHAALCDGCDKFIYGVRHKCLNCPDWDYCSDCVKSSRFVHPGHRFVPIYESLPEPRTSSVRHTGIYCDGVNCKDRESPAYIEGVRYKCAICNDYDLCANCEASPRNKHNRTHPLIKFKTPVRNVSVTTMGEDKNGSALRAMGDEMQRPSTSETASAAPSINSTTPVQTLADVKPREESPSKLTKEKIEIKDLLAEPIQEKVKIEDLLSSPIEEPAPIPAFKVAEDPVVPSAQLNGHFVRDTIIDGSKMLPNQRFMQVWLIRNPGPHVWPAGCSVRYTGGDSMLNIDENHPSTAQEVNEATESNLTRRPVQVGEEFSFRVLMRAPKREGTHISYWRLKGADNIPFGHRLWCHIDVIGNQARAPAFPYTASPPLRSAVPCGYELQLKLLEQQNQKRLLVQKAQQAQRDLVAKQEQLQEARLRELEKEFRGLTTETKGAIEKAEEQTPVPHIPTSVTTIKEEPKEDAKSEAPASPMPELVKKGSQMIFPTLEKESPVNSIHDVASGHGTSGPASVTSYNTTEEKPKSDDGFFEDESVDVFSELSDSDGFMTDEEYDILDAEDEELTH
ncbi:hypothetical protein K402DRAFT_404692 [Aulographum hederae CBS 113979]|uniref:ZZ-type domain-containing protein n=1 Tax=Aulographum hederae CBS 113979 TaxID=1176131 RepID=A0A6G1GZ81_9PEZI|nr:hypothetical protein K402DRAFT_404692 [Aulographum hederae CBS 113979]